MEILSWHKKPAHAWYAEELERNHFIPYRQYSNQFHKNGFEGSPPGCRLIDHVYHISCTTDQKQRSQIFIRERDAEEDRSRRKSKEDNIVEVHNDEC